MARRKLTLQDRIKGARSLLRSTKKVPEHFKKAARALLAKHGYAVALAFALLLSLPAHAQREQVRYASQFPGATVGDKYTAAQNSCIADTAVPCIVIADSTLAVFTAGSIPTPCAQCLFLDYRSIGKIQYANATQTTLADFGIIGFPLLGTVFNGCTAGSVPYSFSGANNTGMGANSVSGLEFCISASRYMALNSSGILSLRSAGVFCWSSSSTDALGAVCDTGLSRGAANEVDCGNGTAADKTCTLKAANLVLTGTCTGCGTGSVGYVYTFCGGTVGTTNAAEYSVGPATSINSNNCVTVVANAVEVPVSHAGTIKNLYVKARVAGGTVGSGVIKLYVNGVASGITCTLGTTLACNDTTHTASVAAGDTWKVTVLTNQVSDTTADIRAGFDLQ